MVNASLVKEKKTNVLKYNWNISNILVWVSLKVRLFLQQTNCKIFYTDLNKSSESNDFLLYFIAIDLFRNVLNIKTYLHFAAIIVVYNFLSASFKQSLFFLEIVSKPLLNQQFSQKDKLMNDIMLTQYMSIKLLETFHLQL